MNFSTNFSTNSIVNAALSLDEILQLTIDIGNTYIVPVICFFGIITNIFCIIVFSHAEFQDLIYKYLYVNSISNFIYLLCCFFLFAPRCGALCDFNSTMITQYYYYIVYTYLKGIPAILTINIQIIVSLYKYIQITNKTTFLFKFEYFKLKILFLTVLSALFYLPILLTKTIKVTQTNSYSMISNDFGNGNVGKILIILITILRGFVSLFILIVINVLTKLEFNKFLEKKQRVIANRQEAECN